MVKEKKGVLERRQLAKERAKQYNLCSDLFISVALEDKKACEYVLRVIMGKPELKVKQVETQETITRIASRGVRLDVLAEDTDGRIFNIEVQRAATVDHARRIRLYSSMIDGDILQQGKDFKEMPNLVVIYISETNIWHFSGAMSRVEKTWEDNGEQFEDGLEIIGVNASVDDGTEVARLMAYFKTADPKDESHGELSKRVYYLKETEGGREMIAYTEDFNYIEGLEDGKEQGLISTAQKMLEKGIYAIEEIADITELSVEKIIELQKELEDQ